MGLFYCLSTLSSSHTPSLLFTVQCILQYYFLCSLLQWGVSRNIREIFNVFILKVSHHGKFAKISPTRTKPVYHLWFFTVTFSRTFAFCLRCFVEFFTYERCLRTVTNKIIKHRSVNLLRFLLQAVWNYHHSRGNNPRDQQLCPGTPNYYNNEGLV